MSRMVLAVLVLVTITTADAISVVSPIDSCAELQRIPEAKAQNIRNLLQIAQHLERRIMELEGAVSYKNASEPDVRFAWSISLSAQQLQEEKQLQQERKEKIRQLLGLELENAKAAAGLVSIDFEAVSYCFIKSINPAIFPGRPKVSFLLQFFRRPWAIEKLVQRFVEYSKEMPIEVIVNVDHPESAEAWINATYATDGLFVPVFSPNVHEIRAYNRMASLARGQYLVLMQDDMVPIKDCRWIKDTIAIFHKYPKVGIVGMNAFRYVIHEGNKYGDARLSDPELGVRMEFVELADFGPFAIRKALFHELGGLDEGLSEPGQCGIWSDWEVCMRCWLAGYQVVHMFAQREGDGKPGGTHRNSGVGLICWGKQQHLAASTFGRRYPDKLHLEIFQTVKAQNSKLQGADMCIYDAKHC